MHWGHHCFPCQSTCKGNYGTNKKENAICVGPRFNNELFEKLFQQCDLVISETSLTKIVIGVVGWHTVHESASIGSVRSLSMCLQQKQRGSHRQSNHCCGGPFLAQISGLGHTKLPVSEIQHWGLEARRRGSNVIRGTRNVTSAGHCSGKGMNSKSQFIINGTICDPMEIKQWRKTEKRKHLGKT